MQVFKNFNYIFQHKRAFLKVEKQFLGKNTIAGYLHDMDKLCLYLLLFWVSSDKINSWHVKHNKHHLNNNLKKTEKDYIQTLIDWTCASMTKPNMSLNAYETLMKYYPEYQAQMLPLMRKYIPEQLP